MKTLKGRKSRTCFTQQLEHTVGRKSRNCFPKQIEKNTKEGNFEFALVFTLRWGCRTRGHLLDVHWKVQPSRLWLQFRHSTITGSLKFVAAVRAVGVLSLLKVHRVTAIATAGTAAAAEKQKENISTPCHHRLLLFSSKVLYIQLLI